MYSQEEKLRQRDTTISELISSTDHSGTEGISRPSNKKRLKNEAGRFHLLSNFAQSLEPLYITVINTLILSQDRNFCQQIFMLPNNTSGNGGIGQGFMGEI